jgi:hypothetical protein
MKQSYILIIIISFILFFYIYRKYISYSSIYSPTSTEFVGNSPFIGNWISNDNIYLFYFKQLDKNTLYDWGYPNYVDRVYTITTPNEVVSNSKNTNFAKMTYNSSNNTITAIDKDGIQYTLLFKTKKFPF